MSAVTQPFTRRTMLAALLGTALIGFANHGAVGQSDPLASWNDGASKKSITDFVARVTTPGGPDFVPVPERIATFDNDGTLWCEQPMYFQVAFALDRMKALTPSIRSGRTRNRSRPCSKPIMPPWRQPARKACSRSSPRPTAG
jgi:hypothetical protein